MVSKYFITVWVLINPDTEQVLATLFDRIVLKGYSFIVFCCCLYFFQRKKNTHTKHTVTLQRKAFDESKTKQLLDWVDSVSLNTSENLYDEAQH